MQLSTSSSERVCFIDLLSSGEEAILRTMTADALSVPLVPDFMEYVESHFRRELDSAVQEWSRCTRLLAEIMSVWCVGPPCIRSEHHAFGRNVARGDGQERSSLFSYGVGIQTMNRADMLSRMSNGMYRPARP